MIRMPIWFLDSITPAGWSADGSVTVPWHEFRELYTEQVENPLEPEEKPEEKESVYSPARPRLLHG